MVHHQRLDGQVQAAVVAAGVNELLLESTCVQPVTGLALCACSTTQCRACIPSAAKAAGVSSADLKRAVRSADDE